MSSARSFKLFLLLFLGPVALVHSPAQTPAPAASADPAIALIQSAITNGNANSVNAYKYTYSEEWQSADNDLNKTLPVAHTLDYQISFIGTVPFRRKVEIDKEPLDAPSVAIEDAHLAALKAKINSLSPQDRLKLGEQPGDAYAFYPELIKANYVCRISGQKKIDKRDTTVVECKLRPGLNPDPRFFVPGDITFWIDKQQPFFNRTRMLLTANEGVYGKGTEIVVQWSLIDGVWQHTSTSVDYKSADAGLYGSSIQDSFSHFQKTTSDGNFAPGFRFRVPLPQASPNPAGSADGGHGRH